MPTPIKVGIVNAMSVDVEDYFQVSAFDHVVSRESWHERESRVVANTERLLEVFDDAHVRATFFILGWVADKFPSLVRRIALQGHELASHGYGHRLVYDLTPEEFRADVRRSKHVLEALGSVPVIGYRAPSYSVVERSLWAFDVLIEEGYVYDASVFPIYHDRYGIPNAQRHVHTVTRPGGTIVEAPPSTVRYGRLNVPIAGGGYFRHLPYSFTRWGIDRLNRLERQPAIFYLHPWEIDPGQPRIDTSPLSKIRHYRNLGKTESRLRDLMRDFDFAPLSHVVNASPWEMAAAPALAPEGRAALRAEVQKRSMWV